MVRTKAKVRQDGLKNEKTIKSAEFFRITKNLESALFVILFLFFFLIIELKRLKHVSTNTLAAQPGKNGAIPDV